MGSVLFQVDFPYDGPWGAEMAQAFDGLARDIAAEDGLLWKIWTENPAEKRAGGVYLFRDTAAAERYRDKHVARLAGFGVTGIVVHIFAVNGPLSAITRAP